MKKLIKTLSLSSLFLSIIMSVSFAISDEKSTALKEEPTPPLKGEMIGFEVYTPALDLPSVVFENAEGEAIKLEDFKNKVILLNFWATWCPPCIDEMPSLDQLQEKVGGDNFAVIALSFDRLGAQRIKKFFDRHDLNNLEVYLDKQNHVAKAFDAYALPTTFIIYENKIIGKYNGPADWASDDAINLVNFYIDKFKKDDTSLVETDIKEPTTQEENLSQ